MKRNETKRIMPPPWVRRTWGRIARIWVPKSSSTRAGGLPKLGAPPSPLGWRRRLRPPLPPSLRAPRRRSFPSISCSRIGTRCVVAPAHRSELVAAAPHTAALRRSGIGVIP